jgi:membrane protease YdiL (CAAX protease family)
LNLPTWANRWAGLGGLVDLILFLLTAGILMLVVAQVALVLSRKPAAEVLLDPIFNVQVQVAFYVLLTGLVFVMVRFRRGLNFAEALALRSLTGPQVAATLFGGAVLALAIAGLNSFFPPEQALPIEQMFSTRTSIYFLAGMAVLVAPLVEEIVFRGYIYSLLEPLWGKTGAVITSGLLFGSIHFPQLWPGYFQMATICLVGIILSLTRARTGNTTTAIILHLGYNALLSVGLLLSPDLPPSPAGLFFLP